ILVREHYNLHSVVGHVSGEISITLDHRMAKRLVSALNRQGPPTIGEPILEKSFDSLTMPCQEELAQLMIIDCVRIWRIGDPVIADSLCQAGIGWPNDIVATDRCYRADIRNVHFKSSGHSINGRCCIIV